MTTQRWRIEFYSRRVEEVVQSLPDELLARFLCSAEVMEESGPDLGMPKTRPMGAGLFELRLAARCGIARVFFGTRPVRRIVILHSLVKKTQKTPPEELLLARRRLKGLRHD